MTQANKNKQGMQTISSSTVKAIVGDFMNAYQNDANARFRSYDHAHSAFKNDRYNSTVTDDQLAKDLFVFLSSWGMLRNAFLLKKDYKFLIPVVKTLRDKKYDKLMDIEIFSLGQPGNLSRGGYVDLILELKEKIKDYFIGKKYWEFSKTEKKLTEETIKRVTDTLVGKILLCVFGCIPAYDDNVRKAMRNLKVCARISPRGLEDLLDWCNVLKTDILQLKTDCNADVNTGCHYSDMKVVDIFLWRYGF